MKNKVLAGAGLAAIGLALLYYFHRDTFDKITAQAKGVLNSNGGAAASHGDANINSAAVLDGVYIMPEE